MRMNRTCCLYIYIHTHIFIYTYKVYIHICMARVPGFWDPCLPHMYTHIYTYIYICTIYIYICMFIHLFLYLCVYNIHITYMCMYIVICVGVYIDFLSSCQYDVEVYLNYMIQAIQGIWDRRLHW